METKYDTYYEQDKVYKMNYAELMEATKERGCMSEEHFLAYLRYKGEGFRCIAPMAVRGIVSPLGMMVSENNYQPVLSRLCTEKDGKRYEDSMYNPLIEKDDIREGNWYHSYKLSMTPVEFEGCRESYYISDFVSLINSGHIKIVNYVTGPDDEAEVKMEELI